jgi:hypothetical protein
MKKYKIPAHEDKRVYYIKVKRNGSELYKKLRVYPHKILYFKTFELCYDHIQHLKEDFNIECVISKGVVKDE